MTQSSIASFERTIHLTNIWLNGLMEKMGWQDREAAYSGLRSVLQAVRDHLTVDEATDLGAQLPMLIRGFYFEGWHPPSTPLEDRSRENFLRAVHEGVGSDPRVDPEELTAAVLEVLSMHVTEGQADHVRNALPTAIRALWPAETAAR